MNKSTIKFVDVNVNDAQSIDYVQLNSLGIDAKNFISALVISYNSVQAIPYTYSGFLYIAFAQYNTTTIVKITGTVRVWYLI